MSSLSLSLPGTPRGAAFGQIVLNEARLAWRRPVGLIAGIGIPVVLLVIFGELPSFQQPASTLGGLTAFDVYVPVLAVFTIAMLGLLGLPIPLASYRELGVMRRLSTTPVAPSWLLAAQGLIQQQRGPRFGSWTLLRRLFGNIFVAGQSPLPEGVELIPQRGHCRRIEPVDMPGAGRAFTDKAGVLEDLEVLGDRRPADRQLRGQLSHRLRPLGQAADDGAPGGVRQHAPAVTCSVRFH